MSIIDRMRKQNAVHWRRMTPDKYGKFSFAVPVEIECRWDDCAEEFRDTLGNLLVSSAVVYPDRDMVVGDMLRFGEMGSDTPDDPTELTDAFEVKRFEKIPNLRATKFLRIARLT